jgi:hypothetical protein
MTVDFCPVDVLPLHRFKYILQMEQHFLKYGHYIGATEMVNQFYCYFFQHKVCNIFDLFSAALFRDKNV